MNPGKASWNRKLAFHAKRFLLGPFYRATTTRARGFRHEMRFWDEWLSTRGLDWPDEFERRLDPERRLSDDYRRFTDQLPGDEVKILDVGAGPITDLGRTHPSKTLQIVPVDPLAESYDALLAEHGIEPPVRTRYAEAERLTDSFPEDSFDLVSARNSIDHCADPVEAIRQMLKVVREGCFVVLNHFENEADNEHYKGLHQWNFSVDEGEFVIRGRSATINVSRELACEGDFECSLEDGWVAVHIRKRDSTVSPPPPDSRAPARGNTAATRPRSA